jgi:hypothetical protein
MSILLIQILNPFGDRLLARIAQVTIYLAVLAPLVWAPRVQISYDMFRRVALIMWGFYAASSAVGVLQVKFPGRFNGATSNNYDSTSLAYYNVALGDGSLIARPSGLSDVPGGAGTAGVNAIVFGLGFLLTERRGRIRVLFAGGMVAGLFSIYTSQVRIQLIIAMVMVLSVLVVMFLRGAYRQCSFMISVIAAVAFLGTVSAFASGGASTVDRFATLVQDDPYTVAHDTRGKFLEDLLTTQIYSYPAGAGLGHWGMMNWYFGTPSSFWAEMMWQALLYDGGVPLIIAYAVLLFVIALASYRIARNAPDDKVGVWAAVAFGYTIASFVASFCFPIFTAQPGLEVMLLNACVFSLARSSSHSPRALPTHRLYSPRAVPFASIGNASASQS